MQVKKQISRIKNVNSNILKHKKTVMKIGKRKKIKKRSKLSVGSETNKFGKISDLVSAVNSTI